MDETKWIGDEEDLKALEVGRIVVVPMGSAVAKTMDGLWNYKYTNADIAAMGPLTLMPLAVLYPYLGATANSMVLGPDIFMVRELGESARICWQGEWYESTAVVEPLRVENRKLAMDLKVAQMAAEVTPRVKDGILLVRGEGMEPV